MGHLSLQELGTSSLALPSSSLSTAPVVALVMGFPNRVWLSSLCLMVARRSSIALIFAMMCVCRLVGCDTRTFIIGSSLVPKSWWGSFGAAGFLAAAVVAGAAVRRLALLPFALLCLCVPAALSVVDGMIVVVVNLNSIKNQLSYFYCLLTQSADDADFVVLLLVL